MITIGFSTRKIDNDFIKHLETSCGLKNVEIIPFENKGTHSLTEVYNIILAKSSNDIVVLLHDDIYFETKNWGIIVNKLVKNNSDFGIIGIAGSNFLSKNGVWWQDKNTMYGIVNHEDKGKKWSSNYSQPIKGVKEMVVVDGLFLIVIKNNIKKNFDTEFKGFHYYDISFCYRNYLEDVLIGVTTDILVTHKSIGSVNDEWENNRKIFVDKYLKEQTDVIVYNNDDPDTYVFVHDQNIILHIENNNLLNSLETYKYVFLGKGGIDKLSKFNNIIVARECEYNLEDYKNLCAYSGWFLLWKNNLINSEYVNLLEYDIELNNFSPILDKFLGDNHDVIGYIPFDVNNYHFIQNPNWTEKLFDTVKTIYKIDLEKIVINKINNGQTYWLSTSNCTLKNSFFNEYMNWLEPILDSLKDYINVGHALERCLSFYCFYKNYNMFIMNGLIKHYQMDSHKTQGHEVQKKYSKINKKVVTFSLWGDNNMYIQGAIENARLMPNIYPDWVMVLYHNNTIESSILKELESLGVILKEIKEEKGYHWRFLAIDEYQTVIFRDCDSRISMREKIAVDEWLNSGKSLHVIRDHPHHRIPYGVNQPAILAGMWGIKDDYLNIKQMLGENVKYDYGDDQKFLLKIYQKYEDNRFIHDTFGEGNKIKHQMVNYHFIGERFDEKNKRFDDYKIIENL